MRILLLCLLLIGLTLVGCGTVYSPPAPVPPSAPVIAGQEDKDRVVSDNARDAKAIAPEVTPQADAILAAVAAAPASDVTALVRQLEAAIVQRDALIAKLTKDLASAKDATDRTIRLGGYALAALLVAAGVASFFLMSSISWLGPRIGVSLLAAGGSVFTLMQAYDWTKAHPWATGIALLFILIAAALAYSNWYHDRKPS